MKTTSLNGIIFEQMLRNGLANLRNHEKEVNDMNVFPVSDGDTGTNMRLTLEHGIVNSPSNDDLGAYLKKVNSGMLYGARGNSGVILSQLFNGMSQSLERDSIVNVKELMDALIKAYKVAYESVVRPVEGTILTVTRDGAEKIKDQINRSVSFETMLSMYLAEMRKSLAFTPELLPVLKESGVVDSGATGFIYIVEGMLKSLYGEKIEADVQSASAAPAVVPNAVPDSESFDKDSEFTLGYCTEFFLQLMSSKIKVSDFNLEEFISMLKTMGDSLVCLQDEDRVRVHIHTLTPHVVIEYAQRFGEFVTFKLENMQLQHNEHFSQMEEEKKELGPKKPYAIIAVSNGEGIREMYEGLGCDVVLEGGMTMNTSSQEFVNAFKKVNAEKIFILPNNKNIFQAANQAVKIAELDNVAVLETTSLAEGYFALCLACGAGDADHAEVLMNQAVESADTLSVAVASKDYTSNSVSCHKDDFIALVNGDLVCSDKDISQLLFNAFSKIPGIEEKETAVIFKGADCSDELEEAFQNCMDEHFPDLEVNFVEGGQEIYTFIVGV